MTDRRTLSALSLALSVSDGVSFSVARGGKPEGGENYGDYLLHNSKGQLVAIISPDSLFDRDGNHFENDLP